MKKVMYKVVTIDADGNRHCPYCQEHVRQVRKRATGDKIFFCDRCRHASILYSIPPTVPKNPNQRMLTHYT